MSYPTATTSHPRSFNAAAGESGSETAVAGFDVTTKARIVRATLSGAPLPGNAARVDAGRVKNQGPGRKKVGEPDRGRKEGPGAWRHAAQVQYSLADGRFPLLLLWEAPPRGPQADLGPARLHLRRVRGPLQRHHRQGGGG